MAADLSHIKDIPGYKTIMKAVLKHQIQQLVEQLSETTGEQSVLLTASVSDGTLSRIGTDLGKHFIDGHDEIMAEFLAFLKSKTKLPAKATEKKKRKAVKTTPKSKKSSIAPEKFQELDFHIEENDHVEESDEGVMEQFQETAIPMSVTEPSGEETIVINTESTHVENKIELMAAILATSAKGVLVDKSERPSDALKGQPENTDNAGTDHVTTEMVERNSESLLVPSTEDVKIPNMDTDVSFENVVIKKEERLDSDQESTVDDVEEEAALSQDDAEWEPDIKKQRESPSPGSSLNVSANKGKSLDLNQNQSKINHGKKDLDIMSSIKQRSKGCSSKHVVKRRKRGRPRKKVVKWFNCDNCQKSFSKNSILQKHILSVHMGAKPWICERCGRGFADNGGLKKHSVTHTGERFSCVLCSKSFSRKDALNLHMKVHAGESRYNCQTCGKSYMLQSKFKDHERTHCCRYCGKSFYPRSILKSHEKTHYITLDSKCLDSGMSTVSLDNVQSAVSLDSAQSVVSLDNVRSLVSLDNVQSLVGLDNVQSVVSLDNVPSVVSLDNVLSIVSLDSVGSVVSLDNAQSVVSLDYAQSVVSLDNLQSVVSLDNVPSAVSLDNAKSVVSLDNVQSVISLENVPSAVSLDNVQSTVKLQPKRRSKQKQNVKLFNCDACPKHFCSERDLKVHALSMHTVYDPPFKCQTCGKGYTRNRNLNKHIKLHHSTD